MSSTTRDNLDIGLLFYLSGSTMRAFKYWLKTSLSVLVSVGLSLSLCAAWVPPGSLGQLASLPGGNAITDPRALLRLALPIENQPVRQLQSYLEDMAKQLRAVKRWGAVNADVSKAAQILNDRQPQLLADIPEERKSAAQALIAQMKQHITELRAAVEAKDKDQAWQERAEILDLVSQLEESMVQKFPFEVPPQYRNLPQLKGR
ncbi:MAG TPA: hypothetical protein V6D03_15320, partial [Candidatus Caenarcaniphilales bacterium]